MRPRSSIMPTNRTQLDCPSEAFVSLRQMCCCSEVQAFLIRHGKTFSSGAITRGKILFDSGEIHARQPATSSLIGSFSVQRKTSLETRRSPSRTSMPVPTMPSRPPGWRAWGFQTRPCESVPGAGKRATRSFEVSSRASPKDASKAPEKEGLCRRRSACCSSSTPKPAPFGAGDRLCSGFGA